MQLRELAKRQQLRLLVAYAALCGCARPPQPVAAGELHAPRDKHCLSVRGCRPYETLAACTAELLKASIAVDEAIDGTRRPANVVAVRGSVVVFSFGCTLKDCGLDRVCCNTCYRHLGLGAAGDTHADTAIIRLARAGGSDAFACDADESATCCPIEARGQEVVVSGRLVRTEGPEYPYVLEEASLCEVRGGGSRKPSR
jgi:hypothetical protein